MLKFSRHSEIDEDLYAARINHVNYVLINQNKISRILKYEEARMETMGALARRTMVANSSHGYASLEKESLINYLIEVERCPESKFINRKSKTDNLSADMKKVLKPLYDMGFAQEFLEYYMEYSSLRSKCNRMAGMPRFFSPSDYVDNFGESLHKLSFTADIQQNLRFNYHNTDLISIPYEYACCYAAEEGYVLAWGDFAQSDLRIAYNLLIRDEWNGPIMDKYEDKYEGISAILDEWEGVPHDHERFVAERDLYKVNVLETIYGQRNGKTTRDKEFITRFAKYLDTCPKYKEYYERISFYHDLGLTVPVTGYFGFEQLVSAPSKTDVINKCLNTPVQTGTSQIVMLTCNAILDKFYSLGYTEQDISLYIVRHDEPIFKMKKEVLKDAWIFNDASDIIVDNWTPLKLSFEFGYYYSEVDQDLQAEVEDIYEKNKHKLSIYAPDPEAEEYWPVPETLQFYVGTCEVAGKTIMSIYNAKRHSVALHLLSTTNPEAIVDFLQAKVYQPQDIWTEQGYHGVIVYNKLLQKKGYDRSLYYSFRDSSDNHMAFAGLLANYAAAKYAKREGLDHSPYMLGVQDNITSLNSVGTLDVLQN